MPAPDGEQFKLYHGTAGVVEGGELRPSTSGAYGPGVYSSTTISKAEEHATGAAYASDIDPETGESDGKTTRPLFGTVYEIEKKNAKRVRTSLTGDTYLGHEPVKIKNAVSFPAVKY